MKKIAGILILFLCFSSQYANSQKKRITREEYIEKYAKIAVKEMKRSGIPASITLAQGMLESDNGNSRLATKGYNHFGIKCHNSWKGKKMYHDDDLKQECFRVYKSARESFKDHTDFLVNGNRYAFLFDLNPTDYKRWAKGLSKAGYATNPKYAKILIRIIEDNKLYRYDKGKIPGKQKDKDLADNSKKEEKQKEKDKQQKPSSKDVGDYEITQGRALKTRNGVEYVEIKKGDTYYRIAREFDLTLNQLYNYNDLRKGTTQLKSGDILYIQLKRGRAEPGKDYHIVKEGETMHSIAQKYGMRLKKLYRKNRMEEGTEPEAGTKLWLRKRKRNEDGQRFIF